MATKSAKIFEHFSLFRFNPVLSSTSLSKNTNKNTKLFFSTHSDPFVSEQYVYKQYFVFRPCASVPQPWQ